MTRTLILAAALLAFTAGTAAQPILKFTATQIVAHRSVWDTNNQPSPLTAYYIQDEAPNGTTSCTRVLYHQSGYFTAQNVPREFCSH